MSLEEKVNGELKDAMRQKQEGRLRALRAIKSAILLAKTAEGGTGNISAEEETKILQKMVKQRRESLEIFQKQNRPDLASKEEEELAVIQSYLPPAMSDEDLEKNIRSIIAETGASSAKDMGKVMGIASKKLSGQADGKKIAELVRSLLGA